MSDDISEILRSWPYEPDKAARRIVGNDGTEKLQVRTALGLEQYELDGRPDGWRPEGAESYLHLYKEQLRTCQQAPGADKVFQLSAEACANLRQESMLYYSRYLLYFQVGEYALVRRDAQRNMDVFRFVHDHAQREEDRVALDQYWPYIIRMHAMAEAMELMGDDDLQAALAVAARAVDRINALEEVDNETFSIEKMRSLGVLAQLMDELREKAPPDEGEIVRQRLRKAVAEQNYERAAQLRDILRAMDGQTRA